MRLRHLLGRVHWRLRQPITLGSRCLVLDGDRVLLVRHTYGSRWYLPGGGVEKGETLAEAARREVREEIGLELGELDLFHVYYNHAEGKHDHVSVFVARSFEGLLRADPGERASSGERADAGEIERLAFFPLAELPPDVSAATSRRIEEYRLGQPADRW